MDRFDEEVERMSRINFFDHYGPDPRDAREIIAEYGRKCHAAGVDEAKHGYDVALTEVLCKMNAERTRAEEAEAKLATAKEEGRREGLEEAAKTCELQSEFEAGIVKLALTLIRADLLAKAKGGAFENNNS